MYIIDQIQQEVKSAMMHDATGHDWFHIERVVALAHILQEREGGDRDIITLATLLHDIGDAKITGTEETLLQIPKEIMNRYGVSGEMQGRVLEIIGQISFKGAHTIPTSLEGKIAQDADRLDGMGAIGIARCFAYGGAKGRLLWNPEQQPRDTFESSEEYRNYQSTSLNHFDEKLFKLKELINTQTARQIAEERDAFLRIFYNRFKDEWYGKA